MGNPCYFCDWRTRSATSLMVASRAVLPSRIQSLSSLGVIRLAFASACMWNSSIGRASSLVMASLNGLRFLLCSLGLASLSSFSQVSWNDLRADCWPDALVLISAQSSPWRNFIHSHDSSMALLPFQIDQPSFVAKERRKAVPVGIGATSQ